MIDPKVLAQLAANSFPAVKSAVESSLKAALVDSISPSAREALGAAPNAEPKIERGNNSIVRGRLWGISEPRTSPDSGFWRTPREVPPNKMPGYSPLGIAPPEPPVLDPLPYRPQPGDNTPIKAPYLPRQGAELPDSGIWGDVPKNEPPLGRFPLDTLLKEGVDDLLDRIRPMRERRALADVGDIDDSAAEQQPSVLDAIEADWYGERAQDKLRSSLNVVPSFQSSQAIETKVADIRNAVYNDKQADENRTILEDWYEGNLPINISAKTNSVQPLANKHQSETKFLRTGFGGFGDNVTDDMKTMPRGGGGGYAIPGSGGGRKGNEWLSFSEPGIAFTSENEGHYGVLANGNYQVTDTKDGKLTTYGGLTIAEWNNGKWVPINGFTQTQVDNRANGISADDWQKNFEVYIKNTENAIIKFGEDNNLNFKQHQFDALVDFAYTNGYQAFNKQADGTYLYDFMNIMLEQGFLYKPTEDQKSRFETALGKQVRMGGQRTAGLWARRMSQLSVFWGELDSGGNYIRKDYGNNQATKQAADAWLAERGLDPTER